MPPKYIITGVLAVVLIFTEYVCGSVGCVEITIPHKLCKCFNTTINFELLVKCQCVHSELKGIPNDLPTPLHDL